MTPFFEKYQQLRHELRSFILIGISATLFDFTFYSFLQQFIPYSLAKTCSFLSGTVFSYLLNKFFTFKQTKHSSREIARFATLYSVSLVTNVTINSAVIHFLKMAAKYSPLISHRVTIILAFLAATAVSTVINFTGQKLWVFKRTLP